MDNLEKYTKKLDNSQVPSVTGIYTVKQLSEILKMPEHTVRRTIEAMGLKPSADVIRREGDGGAKYYEVAPETISTFNGTVKLAKEVDNTSDDAKKEIAVGAIHALAGKTGKEAVKAQLAIMAKMMVAVNATMDEMMKEGEDKDAVIEDLRSKLDESTSMATVETFAINQGLEISRHKAAGITRRLHKLGYADCGKIPSKTDNSLPATLWKNEVLQIAWDNGWFK